MIKIYSIHYNKPEFIRLQKNSIDRYLKIQNDFIILDNSTDPSIKNEIRKITNELNLSYIDCGNQILSNDSISHQNALSKLVDIINDGDTFMMIDHDVFLISDMVEDFYNGYDMVFLNQTRGNINYPSTVLIIFNKIKNKSQISFSSGNINGDQCDTGGCLYHYIKDNDPKIRHISEDHIENGPMLMSILENTFVHLISGSDWNKQYDLNGKIDYIKEKYKI